MDSIQDRLAQLERGVASHDLGRRIAAVEAALGGVSTAHPGLSGYLRAASELRAGPTAIDGKAANESDHDLVRHASVLAALAGDASAASATALRLERQSRLLDAPLVTDAAWARLEAIEAGVARLSRRAHALHESSAGVVRSYEVVVDAGAAATLAAERALSSAAAPPPA